MAKQYKHYDKKTLSELSDAGKWLLETRAEQEADRLMGMRPDEARAQYIMLLAKNLEKRAKAYLTKEPTKDQSENPFPKSNQPSIWDGE